jgi:asparagine synthase (glutamine-hydrolysing)
VASVEERLAADVPLGAFLSGGVDSSLVAAIARRDLGRELDTFSIGFSGSPESEHEEAREISRHLGTRHHEKALAPSDLAGVGTVAGLLDQPNGDSSCLPTYLLSGFAREQVTVCLSGDGGDELFGGYGRYRDTLNDLGDADRIRAATGLAPGQATAADVYMSLRWHIWLPAQAERLLGGFSAATRSRLAGWRDALNAAATPVLHRMRTIDAALYLPGAVLAKVDRMSMRHALEVRSPFLDRDVADFAMGLEAQDCFVAPQTTKRILKDLASDYLPREWMHRPKKGFGLPSAGWSREAILRECRDLLLSPASRTAQHLDRDALERIVAQQSLPGQFSIYQMWPLLILEHWLAAQPGRRAASWPHHEPEAA